MKKFLILFATIIMTVMLGISVNAVEITGQCGDNVYFRFNESTSELIISGEGEIWKSAFRDNDEIKKVVITEGITHTGDFSFSGCDSLETVIFPESLLSIDYYSFGLCEKLTNVTFPPKLSKIDDYAFIYCYGFSEIVVPDSVIYIGKDAFFGCYYINSIIVNEYNTMYSSDQNGILFNKDKTILIHCPSFAPITHYAIPSSVTSIYEFAFQNQQYLTEIIIPYGIQVIECGVFFGCQKLEKITIPCTVATIKESAISGCYNLKYVYYMDSAENWDNIDIQEGAPHDNTKYLLDKATVYYHKHNYTATTISPTCTSQGYTIHTCVCGANYTDNYLSVLEHKYTQKITINPTHLSEGVKTYICKCGNTYTEAIEKTKVHSYVISNVVAPSCENVGYTVYICECGLGYNDNITSETGHNYNGDVCSTCGESKTENCSCNCHKNGLMGIIWKLLRFFYKIFGMNKICSCGVAHY